MKIINKSFFLLCIGVIFFACVEESTVIKQQPTFFDLKEYFESQLAFLSQKSKVYKTTTVDGEQIEKELDSLDFSQELKVFEESDINKVAWMDKYTVDSIFNKNDDLKKIIYEATDKKLRTQRMSISFNKNVVDTIEIFNNASGNVAKLEQHLVYIPSRGYSIESIQKTTFSTEHVLGVDVRFVE